ncbi:EAL domain-containing protein [Xanthomonas cannabis]|uniref:PleD family two-component response regulator/EAL domain-containing protein (Putative c-di-GMP-specific phosphodiesterase class I) n=1 Tax=Xanthomonas cannabis TaxID=1885674 RepID=A0ABR6JM93_9XANT|nr:EAL domain-containing protein [Xanthomonas cannabis]MBB4593961.1 PleD family two-component response regulator/EAL domain-containing protein (putative c-di-GMP-specific phosphodiesterase class I) [Xanthomonas cannabis]MBB5522533.1 PleD family two-component response regulator/EAL domain-containing protein (putative c-di-GMP-specific phosphodiesterase class I) [Xanthomonas cannabis]
MAARDPVPFTTRDDTATRNRPLRAETPPADYWRRWADEAAGASDVAAPVSAAIIPAPILAAAPGPTPVAAPARAVSQAGHSPIAAASSPTATMAGASLDGGDTIAADAPYRVLIVEDDRSQALFAQSVLHGAGMHAQVEMTAASVPQAIQDYHPDLILMDLHMPELDGIRLTTLIRQQPGQHLLPIVFLTGDPDPERQFEVLDSGADDFLTKPIRPRHLIAAVSNRIRRARQQALQQAGEQVSVRSNPETGLPTRGHVMQLLADALERKQSGGLFFIEIASALGLRERYGYAAYERLMTQAGHRLATAAQPYPLARLNDNSFLLLAVDMDEAGLEQRALEIRERLSANAFPVREEESVHVRCAIGAAALSLGFDDTGSALEAVERTALQARLRSDGVQTYLAPSQAEQQEQLRLVEGQLELAYQPIVAVAGGDTAQYQVLLRLRQADGTLLSAGQVIPAAEAAGRIADLDQQVMDHALGLLHLYQHASPPLRLFVSQSPRTLARDAFADWLLKALVERGVAGQSLIVDLRLDDALIHAVTVQQFCARLMPAGVQFCLSQFEPGDEANALLSQLPLSFVRMANRFADAHGNAAVRDQLRGVIDIAHQRGLLIIGQRIEDPQAAAAMWMSGVDFIQGNLVQTVGKELDFDFTNAVL